MTSSEQVQPVPVRAWIQRDDWTQYLQWDDRAERGVAGIELGGELPEVQHGQGSEDGGRVHGGTDGGMSEEMVTIQVSRETAEAMLKDAISDFSELCYSSTWDMDVQDVLWRIVEDPGEPWRWGMCSSQDDEEAQLVIKRVAMLREATGSWFCAYEEPCTVEEYRFIRGFA